MKLFTKIAFVFLLPALALAESGSSSGSGGSVDNGGEYLALKFTKLGQEALSAMKKLSPEEAILSAAELQRMELALVQTRVNGLTGPLLDNSGREVDARYLQTAGKPVIEIDEAHWPGIFTDLDTSYRLVAHEYFRAMGLDDDNYKISARLGEGTVREILHGRLVINPGSIGGQSKFEQLGDYFRNAGKMEPKDFTDIDMGYCMDKDGDGTNRFKVFTSVSDAGPLLPPNYMVTMFPRASSGISFYSDRMKYVGESLFAFIPNQPIMKGSELYFRKKGEYLFAEVQSTVERNGVSVGVVTQQRCYFWKE